MTKPLGPLKPVPPSLPPPGSTPTIGEDLERLREIVTHGPGTLTRRDVQALARLIDDHQQVSRERDEAKRAYHRLKEAMDPDPFPGCGGKKK